MENKIEEAQNTNKLNKSVSDRIKLIKSMNNKIYEKLLRDNNFENNKLKLWVSSIQSEFIQKTPSILHYVNNLLTPKNLIAQKYFNEELKNIFENLTLDNIQSIINNPNIWDNLKNIIILWLNKSESRIFSFYIF